MQLLAETRNEVGCQFVAVAIQFSDDLIELFGTTMRGVQKAVRPKNQPVPFDAGAGSSTPTTAAISAGAPGATSEGTPTTRQWSKELDADRH